MGVQWTKEQQEVIRLRDRNILVSAAAGSGKTAVLVERILSKITDKEHPVDIDRLLIMTFTRAAAGEMKERISAAIEKALCEDPDNEHLQRQTTLLHTAQITTIDGFCAYIIRNYFHLIGLDPGYRTADEGELKLLQEDVLKDGVLLHQITLTTTTLYNGVDIKDRALKHIVSELWNPLVNAQILGRKRPLDADDTCAVYFMGYGRERLKGLFQEVKRYQLGPAGEFRRKFKDPDAWREYLYNDETQYILNTSHKCRTVVLDPREGRYCLRKRAYLQALLESAMLQKMLRYGYQEALLNEIDESLLAKVERLDSPPLLDYLDAHLNEERYCEEWQKIFFEMGHIYNKEDRHTKKSWPGFTRARGWLQHYGYDLHKRQKRFEAGQKKTVWWVTKSEH